MNLTAAALASSWGENGASHGFTGVMVIPSSVRGQELWGLAVQSAFLPLFLTAMFHKCQNCGQCCRAFDSKLARGVEITREEAQALSPFARVTKRSGQHLLKYPCALQKNNKCTQYLRRPYCCRAFPVVNEGNPEGMVSLSIYMACPAGKETYVTTSLFLQVLRQRVISVGQFSRAITLADMEELAGTFKPNEISCSDKAYVMKTAGEMGLR
ncbi:MAG: YkgJ family cysteine cluster protein [Dehalogenimonas sp.]|uniref:YkgJ family cysteine cluster protein n=1 Tax=Candidatus Dehalogenimonas loeffleri TaxID=3127115 RepID=A0ABZ2J9G1_9CHLR|nr:YkgJ family cysteine cluster protein [Dehalogenimonas sp.]